MTRLATTLRLSAVCLTLLGGACVPQSEECARYVECQAAFDEAMDIARDQGGVDTSRWQGGGACWSSFPAAEDCTSDCVEATAQLRLAAESAGVSLPECAGG